MDAEERGAEVHFLLPLQRAPNRIATTKDEGFKKCGEGHTATAQLRVFEQSQQSRRFQVGWPGPGIKVCVCVLLIFLQHPPA